MRVVVPYTRLDPRTALLADQHLPGHERIRLAGDDGAYCRWLAGEWRQPGALAVVEHDVGPHARVLPQFTACPEPWCAFPYPVAGAVQPALGCTRFTAAVKAAEPDLLDVVARVQDGGVAAGDWRRLDVRLAAELQARGYRVHVHFPPVRHFHGYS